MDEGRCYSLEEVATELDIPVDRVRQIESKALMKLRHSSRARLLKRLVDRERDRQSSTSSNFKRPSLEQFEQRAPNYWPQVI